MRPARGGGEWVGIGELGVLFWKKKGLLRWKIELNEDASTEKSAYP